MKVASPAARPSPATQTYLEKGRGLITQALSARSRPPADAPWKSLHARENGLRNLNNIMQAALSRQGNYGAVKGAGCAAVTWAGNPRGGVVGWRGPGNPPRFFTQELHHGGASPCPDHPRDPATAHRRAPQGTPAEGRADRSPAGRAARGRARRRGGRGHRARGPRRGAADGQRGRARHL